MFLPILVSRGRWLASIAWDLQEKRQLMRKREREREDMARQRLGHGARMEKLTRQEKVEMHDLEIKRNILYCI